MKKQILFLSSVVLVVVAVLSRLIPHPWNFTALGAAALFSGAVLRPSWLAVFVPMLALLVSDLILGLHSTMPFTYLGVLCGVLLGKLIIKKIHFLRVVGASLATSLTFFLISNFGVWLVGGLYQLTWDGLVTCFVMALPFFKYQILGDLFFSGVLFGSMLLVKSLEPSRARETI